MPIRFTNDGTKVRRTEKLDQIHFWDIDDTIPLKRLQPYFIAHKSEVLSDNLRKSFNLGVATEDQKKIVYGILLDQDELRCF